jgi:transcription initiation factor TFIIIB Brf1 subunit/transcription initiation factor TFIIB
MNDHAALLTCPMCEGDIGTTPQGTTVCVECGSTFTQEGIDALSHGEHAGEPIDPFEAMAG